MITYLELKLDQRIRKVWIFESSYGRGRISHLIAEVETKILQTHKESTQSSFFKHKVIFAELDELEKSAMQV